MPLNWTEIDGKFIERELTPLGNDIKEIFNRAITFEDLNQTYKEIETKKNDPSIDEATREDLGKQLTKALLAKVNAENMMEQAEQKIAEIIFAQPKTKQASTMHLVMSEIWNEFSLISRFHLWTTLKQNVGLVELASIIDPITNTNVIDVILPTISNISALTIADKPKQSISKNRVLFNSILPKVHNPNLTDKDGVNALTAAAKQNIPSMVKKLLAAGAIIKPNNNSIITALMDNFYKKTIAITDLDLPTEVTLSLCTSGALTLTKALWISGTLNLITKTLVSIENFRPEDIHLEAREDGYSLHAENALKIINMLIDQGLDINSFNSNGMNLFFLASHSWFVNNNWMIDQIIVMPTFNVNAQNEYSLTPMAWVCKNKKADLALKLASREDFNPTIAPKQGYIPYIALLGPQETMLLLEKLNLDINAQNRAGQTLFYWACKHQNIELAKAIARHPDFDVSIVTHQGDGPFIIAAEHLSSTDILDILQSRMAPLTIKSFQGFDALSTAIYWGKLEMAKWVLGKNKLNNPLESGKYPVHIAVQKGNIEVIKLLLDNSYNVNQTSSNHEKFTALQLAEKLTENKEAIISLLKSYGATEEVRITGINQQTSKGQTPCMLFCAQEDSLDITIVDNNGNGPIHYATMLADLDGAKTIISGCLTKGADINARNFAGQTPLIHSIYVGRPDMAIALLDLDVDPMIPDNNGAYPIHIAAGKGHVTVLEKLFTKGLDLNYPASNYLKASPVKLAKQYGQGAVIEWLLDHGAEDVAIDELPLATEVALDPIMVDLGGVTTGVFEVI